MVSTDPAGFDNESTGEFKVMSLADVHARSLAEVKGEDNAYDKIYEALVRAGHTPIEATAILYDYEGGVIGRQEEREAMDGEKAAATAQCQGVHVNPAAEVVIPVLQGPALWFVTAETETDGTVQAFISRVDKAESPLHDTSGDRTDEQYRNRLLLRAVLDCTRGYLEGGDYS